LGGIVKRSNVFTILPFFLVLALASTASASDFPDGEGRVAEERIEKLARKDLKA